MIFVLLFFLSLYFFVFAYIYWKWRVVASLRRWLFAAATWFWLFSSLRLCVWLGNRFRRWNNKEIMIMMCLTGKKIIIIIIILALPLFALLTDDIKGLKRPGRISWSSFDFYYLIRVYSLFLRILTRKYRFFLISQPLYQMLWSVSHVCIKYTNIWSIHTTYIIYFQPLILFANSYQIFH